MDCVFLGLILCVFPFGTKVGYNIAGWLDKNKDPLNDNVVQLLGASKDSLVSAFFTVPTEGQYLYGTYSYKVIFIIEAPCVFAL